MVRITVQLNRAKDGFHVWSQNYDRELDNIFQIQDEIATEVAKLTMPLHNAAVVFGARHAATALFTADQASLAIHGIAIGKVGVVAKNSRISG